MVNTLSLLAAVGASTGGICVSNLLSRFLWAIEEAALPRVPADIPVINLTCPEPVCECGWTADNFSVPIAGALSLVFAIALFCCGICVGRRRCPTPIIGGSDSALVAPVTPPRSSEVNARRRRALLGKADW